MSYRSAFETVVYIVGIAILSLIAAVATFFLTIQYNLQTPGTFVRELLNLPGLKLGAKALIVIGVDSIAYFLLILGLIALFKWRFGKTH